MWEIVEVRQQDLVRGKWHVPKSEKGIKGCNVSSMVTGVSMVVEDVAWLKKKSGYNHINVAELDPTIKGVNLTMKWGLKEILIQTDSVTVCSWMHSMITNKEKVCMKLLIILHHLGIPKETVDEFELKLFVPILWLGWESIGRRWRRTPQQCVV